MESENLFDENCLSEWGTRSRTTEGQHSLFARLSPLLVIKLLPLRVFNDLKSSLVYGELCDQRTSDDKRQSNIYDTECVAALILNRAFNKFEFQDVRKLAAELCGRIHPDVLFPIISSQLEYAAITHDVLKIKACLFSVCTSLVIRGKDSLRHPALLKCRKEIETVLSWPSLDGDEVLQAQHGCIDCLALMVCTELQASESVRESASVETSVHGKSSSSGNITRTSFHGYVIHQLTHDEKECASSSKLGTTGRLSEDARSLSFRLCMANVLISACQKISDTGRKAFSQKIVPQLIQHVGATKKSEIRAACVQVLFSAVYHLKSDVLPYSSDLLEVSMKSLKHGSEKERMAGAKLMASLMASEETVIGAISEGLMEARALLSNLSLTDPSPDLRQLCQKLLVCLTSP
ncbi:hypothetical protein RJ640_010749 [Escallonia rubra]|uniref:ARM repeat superfamily protein n=1 Tax=Escallonia rubra TaxID=112253 RepID=A0AA88UVL9_9ASTE|nr:hypothetical protein RJ640_010749 [Escallonia rubra]